MRTSGFANIVAASVVGLAASSCSPQPSASATVEGTTASCDGASEEVRQFRIQYGLRADDCWIVQVAADPSANEGVAEYGVPLLPFEVADLHGRHTDGTLLQEIDRYGLLFPHSYAGAYVDSRASDAFIASFKDDVARHRIALANLLPSAHIDVHDVDWSTAELNHFLGVVERDQAWFASIRVQYLTADRGITDNFISVDYLGPLAAAKAIEAHFGDPTWLVAERQGPLPWAGPRGTLEIWVVGDDNQPVVGLRCTFASWDSEVDDGGEDLFLTDDEGRCIIPNLPAVAFHVTLQRFVNDDHYEIIKQFDVALSGDRISKVKIELP
jgi:hypothetical protein